MNAKSALVGVVTVAFGITAVVFFIAAQNQKSEADTLSLLMASQADQQPKEKIWIGADECKTTFGPNTIAFCDGVSKDNSMWLDSGAALMNSPG